MLKVGIAGIGFMGWIHWLAYKNIADVEVVAICDTNEKRLSGDWTDIKGNFGPGGERVDLAGIKCCNDLNQFCELEFDLLDICLPPAMHAPMIKRAAANGKHVFSEKPLSLDLASCDEAVAACEAAGTILQVGHVLPFFPEYRAAREIIDSGKYGSIKVANFKRVVADPVWIQDYYDMQKVGGPLLDLHVHDAHFLRLTCGRPQKVYSTGRTKRQAVSYCSSIFEFADADLTVTTTGGVIDQQSRSFTHGFEIQMESASLHFEWSVFSHGEESSPLKLLKQDDVEIIEIDGGDPVNAFAAEIGEMIASVQAGKASDVLSGYLARDAVEICQAEAQSLQQRQPISL